MSEEISKPISDTHERQTIIQSIPSFANLNQEQSYELATLMKEIKFSANDTIVNEDELVDSIFFILQGQAEVTRQIQDRKRKVKVPMAVLNPGDTVGLSDTGFYSQTGKRTATVTAI